jgi:signal transduction histidine kinase
MDGRIRLTVTDKGSGFVQAQIRMYRGMMDIQHRLGLMGCQMQIHFSHGKGHEFNRFSETTGKMRSCPPSW